MRNSNVQHIIRVIAGGYVFYMGCKLLVGGFIQGGMTGNSRYIGLIFGILFILFGGVLAVLSVRNLIRAGELEKEEKEQEEASVSEDFPEPAPAEEKPEEEIPPVKSLFDRAGISIEEENTDEK